MLLSLAKEEISVNIDMNKSLFSTFFSPGYQAVMNELFRVIGEEK